MQRRRSRLLAALPVARGWFDPLGGRSPGAHDDGVKTYPVERRDDGIYVAVRESTRHLRRSSDMVAQTMVNWGVTMCSAWSGIQSRPGRRPAPAGGRMAGCSTVAFVMKGRRPLPRPVTYQADGRPGPV